MIAKISTGSNTTGMVKYNHNKTISSKISKKDADLIGTKNIISPNFDSIVSSIEDYNSQNTRIAKPNIHISLNFHKEDVLDNEKILEIGNDYMAQMGFEDQPYAVYRHFDKDHPHIHIVSSMISSKGKKINDSHIYFRSQALTRSLEEKYNITRAVEKNGILGEMSIHKAINEHLEQGKHSLTGILKRVLLETIHSKPTSEKEFEKMLENYQVKRILSYDKDKNVKGNYFDLFPIEYLNGKTGHKKSIGIEGRALDGSFGYEAIQLQIEMNARQKSNLQNQIMGRVYSVINPILSMQTKDTLENSLYSKTKLSDFKLELKKKGIELIVKRTQTGEKLNGIYGLLFKDIKTEHTYSASDVKLKTIDFIKLIEDNEQHKIEAEIKQKTREEISLQPIIQNHPIVSNSISQILEIFSSLLLNTYCSNQDQELPKKRKKRRL